MDAATEEVWQRNPYIIGRPIWEREFFFGRDEIFRFISDNLREQAKVILLHGQRRIGKSSVLQMIPNFVTLDDVFFFPFDLQDQAREPLGGILHDLASDIAANVRLSSHEVPNDSELAENPDLFTERFVPRVTEAVGGKRIVLLLDEFDVLNSQGPDSEPHPFFRFAQTAVTKGKRMHVIPVIGRRLDEVPRLLSLFRGAPHREIGLLAPNESESLITKPTEGVLSFTREAISAIQTLTSGHPYFTQLMCHELFSRARDLRSLSVSVVDVEEVIDKAIESGEAGLVWFRDGLPIPERVLFSAIAETNARQGSLVSTTIQERAVGGPWKLLDESGVVQTEVLREGERHLIDWQFCRPLEPPRPGIVQQVIRAFGRSARVETYNYKVTIELVARWLIRRHPLRQSIEELEQVDPDANAMYEEGMDSWKRGDKLLAVDKFEQALARNPNHFHALFAAAEAHLDLEEFDQAVNLYGRAQLVDPIRTTDAFARALAGQGRSLMLRGDFPQAIEQLQRALRLDAEDEAIRALFEEAQKGIRQEREKRAVAVTSNPFTVARASPPEAFVGRERESQTILSQIVSGGHVALFGERGIGKTSLLRFVASADVWQAHQLDPTRTFVVYLDCQAIVPFSAKAFWEEALLEFAKEAERDLDLRGTAEDLAARESIGPRQVQRLLRALEERNRSMALLLDEFDVALQPGDGYSVPQRQKFLTELRTLAAHSRGLSIVLSSRRKVSDVSVDSTAGSPWFNVYYFVPLRPFDSNEVQALMSRMSESFALSDSEVTFVRETADGHPYVLQAALSILFQQHAEGRPLDLRGATEELASAIGPFFEVVWKDLAPSERQLFVLIALQNLPRRMAWPVETAELGPVLARQERALNDLGERGLVIKTEDRIVTLFSSLMEWWVLSEASTQPPEALPDSIPATSDADVDFAPFIVEALKGFREATEPRQSIEAWGKPFSSAPAAR